MSAHDAMLVHAVLGGNRSAYGELYDQYAPLIRAVCHDTTSDLTHAQDLAQEVFLRAYDRLGTLRQPDRFAPWLIAITRFVCKEWRRKRSRDRHRFMPAEQVPQSSEEPDPDAGRSEALRKAIIGLPERERLALHAFYLQGDSAEKTMIALGLSRSGFYRALERARERLHHDLSQYREELP